MKFLFFLTFAILFIPTQLVFCQNYQPYYFKLALQWPNSYCNTQERQAPGQGCFPPLPRTFTLHGLWGQDHNGSPLPQCSTGNALGKKDEGDLIVRHLDSVWRSYTKMTNFEFWEHEWNDHGRCLEIGGRQVTPQQYLKGIYDVMMVIKSMNLMTEILEKHRLVPHDTDLYKPDHFLWAIYDRTLNIAQMDCNVDAWLRKQIYEVYFCVSLDFKLINCPKRNWNPRDLPEFYTGRCGHQENSIRFPPNKYESAEPPKKVDDKTTFKIINALISAIIPIILGFMH